MLEAFPEDGYCVTLYCSRPPTTKILVGKASIGQMCDNCLDALAAEWTRNAKFNARVRTQESGSIG